MTSANSGAPLLILLVIIQGGRNGTCSMHGKDVKFIRNISLKTKRKGQLLRSRHISHEDSKMDLQLTQSMAGFVNVFRMNSHHVDIIKGRNCKGICMKRLETFKRV